MSVEINVNIKLILLTIVIRRCLFFFYLDVTNKLIVLLDLERFSGQLKYVLFDSILFYFIEIVVVLYHFSTEYFRICTE